ncbi:MAG: DUF4397 domain-containing protein [Thermomicrobiales bacterium]|nr:MAG: DUF4397 domain-containing protein [Thermomicrobiales bacterium]
MTIRARFLVVVAAMALALVTIAGTLAQNATPTASGSPEASPAAPSDCGTLLGIGLPDDGCIVFINAIDEATPLDLYVNGFKAVDDLTFGDLSGYFSLPSGDYTFDIVPAGQSFASSLLTLDGNQIDAGTAYELAAVGTADAPQFLISPSDLSPLPPNVDVPVGNTRIRVVNAVADAPAIDVAIIGGDIAERVATGLAFKDVSDDLQKVAGSYRLQMSTSGGDFVTLHLSDIDLIGDTVYSVYLVGNAASDDLRLLPVAVDLNDGSSTQRLVPPVLISEIVEVSNFSIYQGDCEQLTGQQAFELTGSGYEGAGPGTLAPWGGGEQASGGLGATPVLYGEGVLEDMNFGGLLGGRTISVVVHDAATGGVVACGVVGGVVANADHFWQHDRLIIGLEPVGNTGISGTATFTEDTGILSDKINVSVSLVTPGHSAPSPDA